SLDEFKIRFNHDDNQHVGSGDGDSQVGDVIARDESEKKIKGSGTGDGAGNAPGEDYYEAEVALAELEDILFDELQLPNLVHKEKAKIVPEEIEFKDLRKKGLKGNIEKKRTISTARKTNE